ncbi:TPA: hypothetical protein NGI80_000182 [Legionella pneumophila]|nr:hypothetical protein [Legionella pneumophila]
MANNDINLKKYTELLPEDKAKIFNVLCIEHENNRNLYLGSAERAINTLFLLNTGGTVTLLTYLFQKKQPDINCFLIFSLCTFIIGIILALIVVLIDFEYLRKNLTKFCDNMCKYLDGDILYNEIRQFQQNTMNKLFNCSLWAGYLSLLCIFLGITFGLYGYFKS